MGCMCVCLPQSHWMQLFDMEQYRKAGLLCTAAAVTVAVARLLYSQAKPRSPSVYDRTDFWTHREPLLELESSLTGLQMPPVTTVTFFRGVSLEDAAAAVRARLAEVIAANPWVAGRVVKTRGEKLLQLAHPKEGVTIPDELMAKLVRVNPSDVPALHAGMPYEALLKAVLTSSAPIPPLPVLSYLYGREATAPVMISRVTIVADASDTNAFALVFSMSHGVVDGDSYYRVLGMLSEKESIVKYRAQRKQEATARMIVAQGADDYKYMNSWLLVKAVAGILTKPQSKVACFYVDEGRVKEAKRRAMEANQDTKVTYVSSNDVLVSSFATLQRARIFTMAMSFRGRIEDLDALDIGNYETALMLDNTVYGSPTQLRRMLVDGAPFKTRHGRPLPGLWEGPTTEYASVSNWSGAADSLQIAGAQQALHLPLIPLAGMPFDVMCIFRPAAGRLAVMIFTKRFTHAQLVEAMPLGTTVSESMFPSE